jgi:hypothetical protein
MTKNFRIELIAPNDWENVPMTKHLLTHSLTHSLTTGIWDEKCIGERQADRSDQQPAVHDDDP